jgi:hypothetical protein
MATKRNLTSVGLPPAVAGLLGLDEPTWVTPAGTTIANAVPLPGNLCFLLGGTANGGVLLRSAAGAGQ